MARMIVSCQSNDVCILSWMRDVIDREYY